MCCSLIRKPCGSHSAGLHPAHLILEKLCSQPLLFWSMASLPGSNLGTHIGQRHWYEGRKYRGVRVSPNLQTTP